MKKIILGLLICLFFAGASLAYESQYYFITGTVTTGAIVEISFADEVANSLLIINNNTTSGEDMYVDLAGYKTIATITNETGTGGGLLRAGKYIEFENYRMPKINLLAKSGSITYDIWVTY